MVLGNFMAAGSGLPFLKVTQGVGERVRKESAALLRRPGISTRQRETHAAFRPRYGRFSAKRPAAPTGAPGRDPCAPEAPLSPWEDWPSRPARMVRKSRGPCPGTSGHAPGTAPSGHRLPVREGPARQIGRAHLFTPI